MLRRACWLNLTSHTCISGSVSSLKGGFISLGCADETLSGDLGTAAHLEQLASLIVDPLINADNLLVLLQTADATLDYRDAANWYATSQLDIEQGGSHAYNNFPQRIPQIMSFLG